METAKGLNDKKESLETYKKIISGRLLVLMNGKSIPQLSREIGLPERIINSWIKKKSMPRIKNLIIISNYFDCTIDYLVGIEDESGNKI